MSTKLDAQNVHGRDLLFQYRSLLFFMLHGYERVYVYKGRMNICLQFSITCRRCRSLPAHA
jgi:hypothetical protein